MSAKARKVPGIHNTVLTELYVVVARDQKGEPRGFEKVSNGRFFTTYSDAVEYHNNMPKSVRASFMVTQVLAQMLGSYSVPSTTTNNTQE